MSKKLVNAKKYYIKDAQGRLRDKVIIDVLSGRDDVVYGARSVNRVMPKYLKKNTEDWDIYTNDNPKTVAKKIEKALDRRYGGNYFYVIPAKHKGTYKIQSKVTMNNIVDVTLKEDSVLHKRIGGVNYATLDFQVKKIKESLGSNENEFRHTKDKETLQRIKIFELEARKPIGVVLPSSAHHNKRKKVKWDKTKRPKSTMVTRTK
jgi:hypothetical protein